MDSFVKMFRKKVSSKRPSIPQESDEISESTHNRIIMNDRASFRMPMYRRQSPQESTNGGGENRTELSAQFPFKSPYSVVTEPRNGRTTRSCPGAGGAAHRRPRNFRKFSPPFGAQSTIHELSGSYENFSSAQLVQIGENKKVMAGREMAEKDEDGQVEGKKPRGKQLINNRRGTQGQKQEQQRPNDRSCAGQCVVGQQQPMSTSEYGSADPSPISEQHQPHQSQFVFTAQRQRRERMMGMLGVGEEAEEEESSSEDGDNSSDEQEISPAALIQFWQHQVRMLKKELKLCRETAEKYRTKYLRLKSRTDELSMEVAKEKERNTWLFNQLMTTNEKMAQLSWAHLHNSQQQQQMQNYNGVTMAGSTTRAHNGQGRRQQHPSNINGDRPALANPFEAMMKAYKPLEKRNSISQHRSAAGEVQADLSSDDYEDQRTSKGDSSMEVQMGERKDVHHDQKQEHLRTPTPIQPDCAAIGNGTFNGFANVFGASGTPFLNFNLFGQQATEVPRGANFANNSQSRLLSPPLGHRMGQNKGLINESPEIIEEDEQLGVEDEEYGGDGRTLEQSMIIPLDSFCQKADAESKQNRDRTHQCDRKLIRRSHSSDNLCNLEEMRKLNTTMLSSSEDDIRMWKKQLRHRGDRVLFRPTRKHLFLGSAGAEKATQRLFRRFGAPEREALANFDYLRDERTDVSGLMSSPEKAAANSKTSKLTDQVDHADQL